MSGLRADEFMSQGCWVKGETAAHTHTRKRVLRAAGALTAHDHPRGLDARGVEIPSMARDSRLAPHVGTGIARRIRAAAREMMLADKQP